MADEAAEQAAAPRAPICSCNQKPMKLAFVSPKVGPLAELLTFRCAQCGHVDTIEAAKESANVNANRSGRP